jgi:hypothetical protein
LKVNYIILVVCNKLLETTSSQPKQIMNTSDCSIDKLEKIHVYTDNHFVVKIKIKDLFKMSPRNWELNRPPDFERCRDIIKYIGTHKGSTDWMFYMIHENNTYKIIDGIHRYTALYHLCCTDEYRLQYNLFDLCFIGEKHVFVSIMVSPSIGETIEKFQTLNKSISISELYLTPVENCEKKKIIEDLTKVWMTLYKPHFTHCPNPQIPNTNRDRFVDLLDLLYEKHNINNASKHALENKLNELNRHVMENIPEKVSVKAIQKCRDTGCYIFLLKKDVLEHLI